MTGPTPWAIRVTFDERHLRLRGRWFLLFTDVGIERAEVTAALLRPPSWGHEATFATPTGRLAKVRLQGPNLAPLMNRLQAKGWPAVLPPSPTSLRLGH